MKAIKALAAALMGVRLFAAGLESSTIDTGYRQMYNLEFEAAHQTFDQWMRLHPADPFGPASDAAAYLFTELDRLKVLQSELFTEDDKFRAQKRLSPDPKLALAFGAQLTKAKSLAEQALVKNDRDVTALFSMVLVYGLRSDYEGLIEKKYLSSLSTTKNARAAAEKLLAVDPNYHDAWVAVGVENYLLSLKPAPLRWFLQLHGNQTDRATGVEKLRITAGRGRYLQPFARLLLAVAALRDKDRSTALNLLQGLVQEFPKNRLYAEELARLR